jgi:hypothetical protein
VNPGLNVNEDPLLPQPSGNLASRDELAATLDQQDQEIHRLALQPDCPPVAAQLVAGNVEREVAEQQLLGTGGHQHVSGLARTMS